jgi:hypothetical protein
MVVQLYTPNTQGLRQEFVRSLLSRKKRAVVAQPVILASVGSLKKDSGPGQPGRKTRP